MPSGASPPRFLNGCSGPLLESSRLLASKRSPISRTAMHPAPERPLGGGQNDGERGSRESKDSCLPGKIGALVSVRSGRSHVCACVGGFHVRTRVRRTGAAREEQKREGIPPFFLCLTRTPGQNAPRAGERTSAGLPRAAGCSLRSCGRDAQRRSIQFVDNPLHYRLSLPQEVRCAASP